VEGAVSQFGASAAFDIAELDQKLPELLQDSARLFYRLGRDRSFDDRVLRAIDRVRAMAKHGKYWPTEIVEPETLLHEMRLLKEPEELSLMRRALDITKEAHLAAMAQAEPGQYEYEIEALISSIFRKHGAERPAYPPIVGSGPNATILHYRARDRRVNPGDLLLIDAGCEYAYYASDVTRTFPASGEFSPCQRAIYEVVLDAQLAAIEKVRPGATLEEIHNAALGVVCDGLRRLGLLDGEPQKIMDEKRYKPYFMHRTSHYLGMDVHDAGTYFQLGKPRPLETGMVITVEPGVYISQSADQVPTEYRGIGVRIEDDVLVVPGGSEVLSDAIPKRVDEVERACRS
jgi:Xaa-Pro aminopeptidase